MLCDYCLNEANLVSSEIIYGKDYGQIWLCSKYPLCDSYVGTHEDGTPLGTMANTELRKLRKEAHEVFDKLWKEELMTRPEAYVWLQEKMGLSREAAHIGLFDKEKCERLIEVYNENFPTCQKEDKAKNPQKLQESS